VLLSDQLVDPVVVTFSQTFLQSCHIGDLHPSAPYLSNLSWKIFSLIIGFQISSYAQIVNLGLAVIPEHVTPNLAPLHFCSWLIQFNPRLPSLVSWTYRVAGKLWTFWELWFWNIGNCHFDAVQLSRVWLFGQFEFSSYMFYLLNKLTNV
jgi:hypothetical protein